MLWYAGPLLFSGYAISKHSAEQYVYLKAERLEHLFKQGYSEDAEMTFEVYARGWLERQTKYAPYDRLLPTFARNRVPGVGGMGSYFYYSSFNASATSCAMRCLSSSLFACAYLCPHFSAVHCCRRFCHSPPQAGKMPKAGFPLRLILFSDIPILFFRHSLISGGACLSFSCSPAPCLPFYSCGHFAHVYCSITHSRHYRYLLWVLQNAPQLSETDEAWAEKLLPANAPEECYMPHK